MTGEREHRDHLVATARRLAERGLSPGGSGSLALRLADRMLVTPTGSSFARLLADELALVPIDGPPPATGPRPSKESGLHRAVFAARPEITAVVHLHAPSTVAVSCLAPDAGGPDGTGPIPPLTPYQLLRLGALPTAPYAPPGSPELAAAVGALAAAADVLLLANHGSVAVAAELDRAADLAEELEAAARLHLTLLGLDHRRLTPEQAAALRGR